MVDIEFRMHSNWICTRVCGYRLVDCPKIPKSSGKDYFYSKRSQHKKKHIEGGVGLLDRTILSEGDFACYEKEIMEINRKFLKVNYFDRYIYKNIDIYKFIDIEMSIFL